MRRAWTFVFLALTACGEKPFTDADWRLVTSPEGGFVVRFPGDAKTVTQVEETPELGKVTTTSVQFVSSTWVSEVAWTDINEGINFVPAALFDYVEKDLQTPERLAKVGETSVEMFGSEETTVGSYPARDVHYKSVKRRVDCDLRLVAVHRRAYSVESCSRESKAADRKKVLASFALRADNPAVPKRDIKAETAARKAAVDKVARAYVADIAAGKLDAAYKKLPADVKSRVSKKQHSTWWKNQATPAQRGDATVTDVLILGDAKAEVVVDMRFRTLKLTVVGAAPPLGVVPQGM